MRHLERKTMMTTIKSKLLLASFICTPVMANVFKTEVLDSSPLLQNVSALETLDFNNDGNKDFISVSSDENNNVLWIGDGNGNFSKQNHPILTDQIISVTHADFNNDGLTDLLLNQKVYEIDDIGDLTSILKTSVFYGDSQNTYSEKFEFGEYLNITELGDMDNDGLIDVVSFSGTSVIIYKNNGNNDFIQQQTSIGFNSSFVIGKRLQDMDNDGDLDVLGSFTFSSSILIIFYNEGDYEFSRDSVPDSLWVRGYYVSDVNNDNLMDIVFSSSYRKNHNILLNKGDRSFELMDSDIADISWTSGINDYQLFDFKSIMVEDLDNDGREDIVGISREQIFDDDLLNVRVRMHEQNNRIEYYNNTEIGIDSLYLPSIAAADFNGDGLKDLIVSGNSEIKLLTQISNPKIEDIYYDPNHNGHGYSIEKIGRDNLYYTLFYSYDETGNSEWYIQLNTMLTNNNGDVTLYSPAKDEDNEQFGNLVNFNYDYSNQSVTENTDFNKYGYIQNSSNADSLDSMNLDFYFNNENKEQNWQSNRLIANQNKPENDFSGLWWAGYDDSGWGLSLNFVQRQEQVDVVAILYFYDAEGQARWISGQAGNFLPSQPLNIEMNMYNGYGREHENVELTYLPAGNLSINLNEASKDFNQAGTLTMDVFYPKGERQDWIRNNIPFALSSEPRD